MRSRIYSSRFYPVEIEILPTSLDSNIFVDLERANKNRIEQQRTKSEIKWKERNRQLIGVRVPLVNSPKSEIVSVQLVGRGVCFESDQQITSIPNPGVSRNHKAKTSIFNLVYKNGATRQVEVLNGSQSFRFLLSQCKKI